MTLEVDDNMLPIRFNGKRCYVYHIGPVNIFETTEFKVIWLVLKNQLYVTNNPGFAHELIKTCDLKLNEYVLKLN